MKLIRLLVSAYTFYTINSGEPIVLSKDGQFLYSASHEGTIKEWNIETGECLHTIDYRLCAGANITNVKGLTPAQIDSLIALGAITDDSK